MARPAEFPNGAVSSRCAQRPAQEGIGELIERIRQRIRIGGVVEQPLFAVADDAGKPLDAGRDDRKAGRHVLEDLERRPVEFMRQRRMSGDVEGRDANVGSGEDRRHVCVRHGSDECNAVERGGGIAYARQLRAVADEHRFDVVPATRAQPPDSVNQRDRAVPRAKSPGKHRNDVTFIARNGI